MAQMTIGEVARQVGVRPSTLRYYESIGLLPAPARISGQRSYDPAVIQRLEIIRTAQQAGFTLAETRILFDDILANGGSALQWQSLIQRKLRELDDLLANVQSMKTLLDDILHCDGDQLEECIYETGQKHRAPAL